MKRFLVAATVSLALAACAAGQRGPRFGKIEPVANPSAVIAAELAFARLAQDKGQWAAFRATAADGAEMFVPQRVKAADWLKGRAEPAVAVKWQAHAVWSSCDGSYAVTRGGWDSPNASGTFATIWQRQKNGDLKWIADMSLTSDGVAPAPEMIAARVAECKVPPPAPPMAVVTDTDWQTGTSRDGTLHWGTGVTALGGRTVKVSLWNGTVFEPVLEQTVPAPVTAR
ncbi:MAG: hypothetical protein RL339_2180 [Pseudomonadota bacterium]|jgi:hypothetical protein